MPKKRRAQSPEKLMTSVNLEQRHQTRAQKSRDTSIEAPKHPMVTRSRSHDNDNRIVFSKLADEPSKKTKGKQKQPVQEKTTTIKTSTKTSDNNKQHLIVPNDAYQSSDEENQEPEEPPPKAEGPVTLRGLSRSVFSPIAHTSTSMLQNRPAPRRSAQMATLEPPSAPEVAGPSTDLNTRGIGDKVGELQKSPLFLGNSLRNKKVQSSKTSWPIVTSRRTHQTPAAPEAGPSTHPDPLGMDDEIEEPQEAEQAPNDVVPKPSDIKSLAAANNLEEAPEENRLLPAGKAPESQNHRSEAEDVINLDASSWASSPDVDSSHPRSSPNITMRRHETPLSSVSDAVISPHATDNWTQIKVGLANNCETIQHLKESISIYNVRAANNICKGLNYLSTNMFAPSMDSIVFHKFLKIVTDLTLQLPILIPEKSIPIMKSRETTILSFSRKQIACLLANGFLCTFPEDPVGVSINFSQLFECFDDDPDSELNDIVGEKVKNMMDYFLSIGEQEEDEKVTFKRFKTTLRKYFSRGFYRRSVKDIKIKRELQELPEDSLLIIFTNSSIGGGVFTAAGAEESNFFSHPELLVLRLLAEPLEDDEYFFVSGVQQFSNFPSSAKSSRCYSPKNEEKNTKNILIMKWGGVNWPRPFTFDMDEFSHELNRMDCALRSIPYEILDELEIIAGGPVGDDYHEIQFLLLVLIAGKYSLKTSFFTHGDNVKFEKLLYLQESFLKYKVNIGHMYQVLEKYRDNEESSCHPFCFWLMMKLSHRNLRGFVI